MEYVYLIKSLENGYYKIGMSKNPIKRIKQLQTGNSSKLKLIETYQTEYASHIEKTLHRRYSYLRKEGEWFDFSIEIEISFMNECKQIEKNITILKENGNVYI